MITKIVKRYYCEHCRKAGMTKAIQKHEDSCIHNPARVCFVCEEYKFTQEPMADLIAAAEGGISEIQSITDCPCCTLAALVQYRKSNPEAEWEEFDYREAMKNLRSGNFENY